jgi:hypothetical protein
MATGVNNGSANPTFHGEIVAIDDYVARHGNRGWGGPDWAEWSGAPRSKSCDSSATRSTSSSTIVPQRHRRPR